MHALRLRTSFLASCAIAVLTAACGQGHEPYSPTAPTGSMTPLADNGPDVSAVASVDGAFSPLGRGGNGRGNHGGAPGAHDDAHGPDHPGRSHEAKVVGFVTAKGAEALTVEGITIEIEATTLIRHGNRTLTIDDIEIGDHVQARGMMNEDETILTAIEVKVEDTGNDNEDDDAELRGTVAGLPGPTPCPNLTFTIGGTTVKTNIDTSYEGVTCAALANGNIVEVEGETQADGSVRAEDVELEAGPDEVEGKISGGNRYPW